MIDPNHTMQLHEVTDGIIATLKTQLEDERNYISVIENQWKLDRDYIQELEYTFDRELLELLTDLKQLKLDPLTYDGENNDEVDSFTAGYNAALEDMRDILHKYFPKET